MLNLLSNGFLLFIPVLIWNIALSNKLPDFFKTSTWDKIPKSVLIIENTFRFVSFLLPLLMIIDFTTDYYKYGLALYVIGISIYFISWLLQFKLSNTKYNKSLLINNYYIYVNYI